MFIGYSIKLRAARRLSKIAKGIEIIIIAKNVSVILCVPAGSGCVIHI